jgi:hypothetical protein
VASAYRSYAHPRRLRLHDDRQLLFIAKLRLFDRRSYCGPAVGNPVKSAATVRSLAPLLTPLLIFGRALG